MDQRNRNLKKVKAKENYGKRYDECWYVYTKIKWDCL